jgi:carboxylesterase
VRSGTVTPVSGEQMDVMVTVPGAEPWSARGTGPRGAVGIVVVHGFTANAISTRPLGQRLAVEGYSVEVPLLPGHGTSSRDLARTRYSDWRATVALAVETLARGCDDVIVVGHSMGGTIALDLAASGAHRLAGVVPINALVLGREQLIAKLAPYLQHVLPFVPRDAAGMPTDDIAKPGVSEQSYRWVSARAAQSLITELPRVRAGLASITCPALVVTSSQDHTVDPNNGAAIVEGLRSSRVETLTCERSYHAPLLDYDAALVEDAVLRFVAGVTGT